VDDAAEVEVDDTGVLPLKTPLFARACAMIVETWIGSNEGLAT
jgi:hypothetical protein